MWISDCSHWWYASISIIVYNSTRHVNLQFSKGLQDSRYKWNVVCISPVCLYSVSFFILEMPTLYGGLYIRHGVTKDAHKPTIMSCRLQGRYITMTFGSPVPLVVDVLYCDVWLWHDNQIMQNPIDCAALSTWRDMAELHWIFYNWNLLVLVLLLVWYDKTLRPVPMHVIHYTTLVQHNWSYLMNIDNW